MKGGGASSGERFGFLLPSGGQSLPISFFWSEVGQGKRGKLQLSRGLVCGIGAHPRVGSEIRCNSSSNPGCSARFWKRRSAEKRRDEALKRIGWCRDTCSAILAELEPGVYTAEVESREEDEAGDVLIEV